MNQTSSLEDLYRAIARQWRVLVTVAAIAVMLAVITNFVFPLRYEANALLTVEPLAALQSDGGSIPVNMETERVVATSTEVLSRASKKIPAWTIRTLQDAVEVSVPKNSQVLDFGFSASTPEAAAAGANAIALAYNAQRVANAQRVVSEATQNIEGRVSAQVRQLDAIESGSTSRRNIELQIEALQGRLAALSSATFSAGSLISPAVAPAESTKPSLAVFIAAGLSVGVLLGSFLALARDRSRFVRTVSGLDEADATVAHEAVVAHTRSGKPPSEVAIFADSVAPMSVPATKRTPQRRKVPAAAVRSSVEPPPDLDPSRPSIDSSPTASRLPPKPRASAAKPRSLGHTSQRSVDEN